MHQYINLDIAIEDVPANLTVGQEIRYRRKNGVISVWAGDTPIDNLGAGLAHAIVERPEGAVSVITCCEQKRVEIGVYTDMTDAERAWFVGSGAVGRGKVLADMRTDEHRLTVKDNAAVFDREIKMLCNVTAALEEGEALEKRITATRMLAVGLYALAIPKKTGGTKFIVVEGPDFFWNMEVARDRIQEAMEVIAAINNQSKQLTPQTKQAPIATISENESENFVDRLERLAKLHETGALTDDEFTAAKAKLISL